MKQTEKLLDLLARHIGFYQNLAELLSQEQKSLITLDHDHLLRLARAKEIIIKEIAKNSGLLAGRVRQLAERYGLNLEPLPSLIQLSEVCPEPFSGPLRRAGHTLARLKQDVSLHNRDNQDYVKEALGLIESTLNILTGQDIDSAKGYAFSGHRSKQKTTRPLRLSREV